MASPLLMKLPKLAAFLHSVERNSIGSKNAYFSGLRHLNYFISRYYPSYTCETILQPLLKNKINIYELFERFISYLLETRIGITPKSISLYVTALRSYFAYYDLAYLYWSKALTSVADILLVYQCKFTYIILFLVN
jgi:hypothetical protein